MSCRLKWGAVDPRLRGGGCRIFSAVGLMTGRSPPARGRLEAECFADSLHRSIPACAGEAKKVLLSVLSILVDPRLRGGGHWHFNILAWDAGRSPPARGRRIKLTRKFNR